MTAAETVATGSLLLAAPIAFAAGAVSFLSPCVLPLVPGYLSYVTGLTGAELAGEQPAATVGAGPDVSSVSSDGDPGTVLVRDPESRAHTQGRVLLGSVLFVLGFTAVFVSYGLLFGALGEALLRYQEPITRVIVFVLLWFWV
jgi:cytochrome c-type biogenesis protein